MSRLAVVSGVFAAALAAQEAADDRARELAARQQRGALDVPAVVAALGADATTAAATAAIVRHEWLLLPPELFTALDEAPRAAEALLGELALAPRPAARAWIETALRAADLPPERRCLLLAARGEPLAAQPAQALADALAAGTAGDGFHAAAGLLLPAAADALLGRLHALLADRTVEVGHVLPVLDRLSPAGWRSLLGLVAALPQPVAEQLCLHLAQHDVPAYAERMRAALDGEIPLEPLWLLRAAPLLGAPARAERLLALLADPQAAAPLQARAADALVEAGCRDGRLLRWILEVAPDRAQRVRRLLDVAVHELPEPLLLDWLGGDREIAPATAAALVRRQPLGAALEAAAADRIAEAGVIDGPLLGALAQALVQQGGPAAIDRIWPALRGSHRFGELTDLLARRRVPFAHERLLAELAAPAADGIGEGEREEQLDAVRLLLVALGDRRQLAELVAHARERSPVFVRRCAHHARMLPAAQAVRLLDDAAALADDELAAELIGWAAGAAGETVETRLQALWRAPEPSERQEMALRGLIAGPARAALVTELAAALRAGPLTDRHEQLAYEVIATMPSPLGEADLRLCAELVLLAPLADPPGETARARRWPDGRFGFPLAGAVAQRLRGGPADAAGAAFGAVAAEVLADPRHPALSRQRLLVLWRSLEMEPALQRALGQATAALLLALPGGELGAGPAHLFLAQRTMAAGDFTAAAAHARAAVAGLLRLPAERRTARLFLGERDPAAGDDPWAALAALPHLAEAAAARVAGDPAARARALASAREFAGHDAATLQAIELSSKDPPR